VEDAYPPVRVLGFVRLNRALAALVLLGWGALAVLSSRVRDWVVMTDELQYAKLATHIGQTLSPIPTLRGVHVSSYAQVYPVLLAPFYGVLSAPSAFRAAHLLNALLFASAAIPVYLLAREVGLSPRWRLVCAALALVLPWNVETGFVLTESAAYPVFCWASLALVRAVSMPTPRRDALALAALVVAFFTRTQFLALAGVLPLVVLLHDGRAAHRRHGVLAGAYALGLLVAIVVQLTGGIDRVLGNYAVTATHGSVLPWKAIELAGAHLDLVGVGIGILPLLLGGAWIVENAVRRSPFALYALITIVVLTLETSSYDARFGGGLTGIRGRYLFYVAPLLLVATARLLDERRVPRVALAGVTCFFAITVLAHDFPRIAGLYVDAPVAVLNDFIQDSGGKAFVALAAIVLALGVTVPRWSARTLAVTVVVFVFAASLATSAVAWSRLLGGHGPSSRPVQGVRGLVLDWVDRVLPSGAHTAIVPYVVTPLDWGRAAILWWDVEFWNRSVDRAFVVDGHWEYAPFPHRELRPDPVTGVIAGTAHDPEYVVAAIADARLRLAGVSVGRNYDLDILQVERPYRVLWRTSGLDPDGWIINGRPASLRLYAQPGHAKELVGLDVALLDGAGKRSTYHVNLCVPAGRYADAKLPNTGQFVVGPLPANPPEGGMRLGSGQVVEVTALPAGKPC
jgi:hypothetical protein